MNKYTLKAVVREQFGHSNKKIRKSGFIPGNIFGKNLKSTAVQVSLGEFKRIFNKAGETSVVWLSLDGEDKERPTLISSFTLDPIKNVYTHIDFHQVNLKEKVTAFVPVHLVGESEIVKSGQAVLSNHLYEIEVEALPTEIPESFSVDISILEKVGDHLSISSLNLPKGVTLLSEPESIIVSLGDVQKEEEPLTPAVEAEVAGEEKKDASSSEEKSE